MSEAENLLGEWAWLLMTSLADAGVRDVVTSPGSRSTPFVAAALREERLRMHAIVDERAAAFFALGQARATGRPSVLLCTSGSAGAHYFPAVIEANASGLPLVVLTADRPTELMDCGAPQTIDQTKLFGDHARKFIDLGAADASPLAMRAMRRMAAQAVLAARYPLPGAVHVNARARKPLEPAGAAVSEAAKEVSAAAARVRALPIPRATLPHEAPDEAALDEIAELSARTGRGLVVCGPAPASFASARAHVLELARRTGFPVLAELPSQLRLGEVGEGVVLCDGFDAFLRSHAFREEAAPELIVQLGSTPTSTGFEQYSSSYPEVPRVILTERAWAEPMSAPSHFVFGDVTRTLGALVSRLGPRPEGSSEWTRRFAEATRVVASVLEEATSPGPLTEGRAARAVMDAVPNGSGLMLANSLPLRTAELFARRRGIELGVFCQRGANGIDGLVAGSCGAARSLKRPFSLLIGDVSLLHDLTSLALTRELEHPFVVVVLHNGGGRIFEQLPLGAGPATDDAALADLFARTLAQVSTPHAIEFSHAAALFGLAHARVTTEAALRTALEEAYATPRASLIEVVVPPSGAVLEYRRIWREVDRRLAR